MDKTFVTTADDVNSDDRVIISTGSDERESGNRAVPGSGPDRNLYQAGGWQRRPAMGQSLSFQAKYHDQRNEKGKG